MYSLPFMPAPALSNHLNALANTAHKATPASEGEGIKEICSGTQLTSPGGRLLQVQDVFVPKFNSEKSKHIPSQFRNLNRKIVVFKNGSVAPLREVQSHYRLFA